MQSNKSKIIWGVVTTAVIISGLSLLAFRYKPKFLNPLFYNEDGFPRIKKEGDIFTVDGISYIYSNGQWRQPTK